MSAKTLAAAGSLIAAAAALVLFPSPAQADTVSVNYSCEIPLTGTQTGDVDVTITAPATATVGETVDVTVTTGPIPILPPIDLDAGSVTPSGEVTVSGAQTGAVAVTGTANTEPYPANQPVQLTALTGQLTLTTAGDVELSPGAVNATAVTIFGTFTIPCVPSATPTPVSAVISVS
ncbi:hypothetical protein [Cryptosporangium japonicum]|uniref:Uncharacterized protein n=1 Tax=Cryptosporangium japonicum TaxID=80872 RepID=A0ABP3ECU9_9ACTN